MAFPPLPVDGATPWGATFRDWAAAVEAALDGGGGGDAFGEGVVPIFETLAQAEAWEAANPGRVALTIETSADTTDPTWTATLTAAPSSTSVAITASALASDDTAVTAYEYSLNGTAGPWQPVARSGSTFTITGLLMSSTYATVSLRALDGAGNASTPLAVPSFTTTVEAPSDFAYQWVATDFTSGGWPDTVAGATLTGAAGPTLAGGEVITSNVGWTAPLSLGAGAKTLVLVGRLVSAISPELHGYVGQLSGPHAIAIPGGGGAKAGWYSHDGTSVKPTNVGGSSSVDQNRHVIVARVDGASSTLTVDRVTAAANGGTPSFATFQVGGNLHGYGRTHGTSEIRIYDRRLADAEITALVTELGATHGIAL